MFQPVLKPQNMTLKPAKLLAHALAAAAALLLHSSCTIVELGEITQREVTPPYLDEPIVPKTTVVVGVTADSIVVLRDGELSLGVRIGDEEIGRAHV